MTKESYCKLSINEKLQLYFTDSSLIPLFIQVIEITILIF